jgi:type I restriction enzyme S subunit
MDKKQYLIHWQKVQLGDMCNYYSGRIQTSNLTVNNYISTENILPDKSGITVSSGMPSTQFISEYQKDTVLVSNIRPYFKKIWFATQNGGCSNDVLVFKVKENCYPKFLYYLLSEDRFFDYATQTAKGTKMPRGDKSAILNYMVPDIPLSTQRAIAATLSCLDDKIELNRRINANLEAQAQAIFKSWFVDFDHWDGVMPDDWRVAQLGDVSTLSAGGDKPALCSPMPTDECTIPVFSNGIDNFGLYGYTDRPKVAEESVTVSARGTIGFVCLRQDPFVPIVRLLTAIPNNIFITAKYLYLYLKSIHIVGVGTTQQQLTVPDFRKYRILVPSFEVVEDFTRTVDPIYEIIRHKRTENEKLAAIRDALLPKLMSGEIEVEE